MSRQISKGSSQGKSDFQRVLSASGLYALSSFAQRGVSFLLLPIYTRFIAPEEYGLLELLNAFTSVLYAILLVGLPSAVAKCFHRDCDSDDERASVLWTAIFLDLPVLLLGGLALFFGAEQLGQWLLGTSGQAEAIQLVVTTGIASSIIAIALAGFRAQERALVFGVLSLLQFLVGMGLNVLFVVHYGMGMRGVLWGNLISNLVALPLTLLAAKQGNQVVLNSRLVTPLLHFGVLQIPVMLAQWITNLSDRYVLRLYRDLSEIAVYGVGYKIGMVLQLTLVWPFQLAWPTVAFSISRRPGHQHSLARALTYLTAALVFGILGLSLVSRSALPLLVGPNYQDAYQVVPLIALAYALNGIQYCAAPGVHIGGRSQHLSLLATAGAGLNLGLNFLLIPRFGMFGAAASTVVSFLLVAVATLWLSQRAHPVTYERRRLVKIWVVGGLVMGCGIAFEPITPGMALGWHLGLVLIAFPALLLLGKGLEDDEKVVLRQLWRRVKTWRPQPKG